MCVRYKLFMVAIKTVSKDGHLAKVFCTPVCPQYIVVHSSSTVWHVEQSPITDPKFTLLCPIS